MPIFRLQEEHYRELGKTKNIALVGFAPSSTYHKADWVCLRCRRHFSKSYHDVKYRGAACNCQRSTTHKAEHYRKVAKELGIMWIGGRQPYNTTDKTLWLSKDRQTVVEASYCEVVYKNRGYTVKRMLGILV